jgi:hypothetical protein
MPRSLQPTRVALLALTLVASALIAAPAGATGHEAIWPVPPTRPTA